MTLFIIHNLCLKNVHKVTYTMLAYCAPDLCMALFLLLSFSKLAIATIQEQVHGCQLWHTHTCLYKVPSSNQVYLKVVAIEWVNDPKDCNQRRGRIYSRSARLPFVFHRIW